MPRSGDCGEESAMGPHRHGRRTTHRLSFFWCRADVGGRHSRVVDVALVGLVEGIDRVTRPLQSFIRVVRARPMAVVPRGPHTCAAEHCGRALSASPLTTDPENRPHDPNADAYGGPLGRQPVPRRVTRTCGPCAATGASTATHRAQPDCAVSSGARDAACKPPPFSAVLSP